MLAFNIKVTNAVFTNNEIKRLIKVPDNALLKLANLSKDSTFLINNYNNEFTINITNADAIYNTWIPVYYKIISLQ